MTSELGERYIERMKEQLDMFQEETISLQRLIAQLEALLDLLLDEADPEWHGELEAECNRLEFAYAAALNGQRNLSDDEQAQVDDAVAQLRLMLTRY